MKDRWQADRANLIQNWISNWKWVKTITILIASHVIVLQWNSLFLWQLYSTVIKSYLVTSCKFSIEVAQEWHFKSKTSSTHCASWIASDPPRAILERRFLLVQAGHFDAYHYTIKIPTWQNTICFTVYAKDCQCAILERLRWQHKAVT